MKLFNLIQKSFFPEKGDKDKWHSLISDFFRPKFERVKVRITKGKEKNLMYFDILIPPLCDFEIELENVPSPEILMVPHLFVFEAARGKGLGPKVVSLLKDFAIKNNFKCIQATAVLDESIEFWLEQGFVKLENRTYYYNIN